MRPAIWAAAGMLALFLTARPASAQQTQQASSFLTGVSPGNIVSTLNGKPFDLSKAIAPTPGQSALQNRFNFTTLFNKLTTPSPNRTRGVSDLPAPGSFPSTKYPNARLVGTPPFPLSWMFGDSNVPRPGVPMHPIIPDPGKPPVGPGSGN